MTQKLYGEDDRVAMKQLMMAPDLIFQLYPSLCLSVSGDGLKTRFSGGVNDITCHVFHG